MEERKIEGSKLADFIGLWNDRDLRNHPEFVTNGFNLLPGGYRDPSDGTYFWMGDYGYICIKD